MSDRFTITVRRAAPGDQAWPLRWFVTVHDDEGHRRVSASLADPAFTKRGAHRIAERHISKVLRSEASEAVSRR